MQCALSAKVSLAGRQVTATAPKQRAAAPRFVVRAEEKAAATEEKAKPWAPPALDASAPSPIFGGSTGEAQGQAAGRHSAAAMAVSQLLASGVRLIAPPVARRDKQLQD